MLPLLRPFERDGNAGARRRDRLEAAGNPGFEFGFDVDHADSQVAPA